MSFRDKYETSVKVEEVMWTQSLTHACTYARTRKHAHTHTHTHTHTLTLSHTHTHRVRCYTTQSSMRLVGYKKQVVPAAVVDV